MCTGFFRGGAKTFRGGHGWGTIFLYRRLVWKTGTFLPLLPQKLQKRPPNEVKKNRNRTGERSEPRKFWEYECSKPIFWAYFCVFPGNWPGEHFLGSNFRGGGGRGANSDQGGDAAMHHLPPPPCAHPCKVMSVQRKSSENRSERAQFAKTANYTRSLRFQELLLWTGIPSDTFDGFWKTLHRCITHLHSF